MTIEDKINAGRDWVEIEIKALAIERGVRINQLHWSESADATAWIASIHSAAGDHTIAFSTKSLELASDNEDERLQVRTRIRGLVGDLARIERRGFLR